MYACIHSFIHCAKHSSAFWVHSNWSQASLRRVIPLTACTSDVFVVGPQDTPFGGTAGSLGLSSLAFKRTELSGQTFYCRLPSSPKAQNRSGTTQQWAQSTPLFFPLWTAGHSAFPRVHFRMSCAQQNGAMFLPGLSASLGGPWLRWHDEGISASDVPGKLLSSCPSQMFAFPGFLWNFGAHLACVSLGWCGTTGKLKRDCFH